MGFCCGASDVQVLPKNSSSSGGQKKKQRGVKREEVTKKRKSSLDRAPLATPHFPLHARPGLM